MTPDTMEINGSKYVREGIWLEAERELSAVSAAIGSVRWMDLPDGGSVTLAEQVGRMRADLETAERERDEAWGARNENAKLRGQRDAALASIAALTAERDMWRAQALRGDS